MPFIVNVALSSTPSSRSVVAVVTCAFVVFAEEAPKEFALAGSAATDSLLPFSAVSVSFSSITSPVPSESFTLLTALSSSCLLA